ncbi:MAG: hypothetical protein E6Q88_14755 [Lysobacteraceae bacterium]|nr:MAG: hypothetical protein E6Q88_14755 [Xanthomonadaceae bacterium]
MTENIRRRRRRAGFVSIPVKSIMATSVLALVLANIGVHAMNDTGSPGMSGAGSKQAISKQAISKQVVSKRAKPEILLQHADDRARIHDARGMVRVEITCSTGIGRATLNLPVRKDRTESVVLRLRYAPRRPYPPLEGLQVDGQEVGQDTGVSMRRRRGWLEIRLPLQRRDGPATMRLQWIDHYR